MRAMAMTGCALLATFVVAEQTQAADVPPVNRNLRVESLGTPVKRRMGNWVLMYRAPADGALHLFCSFAAANGYTDDPPSEILDFNLGTGEIVHVPGPQGGTYLRPGWVHPNGKMYCTTTRPVTLLEYDPVAKKLRICGHPAGFYNTIHDVTLSPDGVIWMGHNGRQLSSYDPAGDEMKDHGVMGGGESQTNQYIYTLVADGQYVYSAIANHGRWYLVAYDHKTGEQTAYFEPPEGERSPVRNCWQDADGNLYYGAGKGLCRLEVGKPVPAPAAKKVEQTDPAHVWTYANLDTAAEFGLEIDTTGFAPTSWNNGLVVLKWRKVGEEQWTEATYKGLDVFPNCVSRLAPAPEGGKAYGFAAFYGPLFEFDLETGQSTFMGDPPGSVYDIVATRDYVYYSGYSAFFSVYDRMRPFTRVQRPARRRDTAQNPFILAGAGKRTFRIVLGADGTVYACGNYSRHDSGADVAYYVPPAFERMRLREEVKEFSISDICALNNGSQIILALGRPQTENVVYMIFDNATKKIIRTHEIELGVSDPGVVFSAGPDTLVALSTTDENKAILYKLDTKSGALVFRRDLEGDFFNGPSEWDFRDIDQRFPLAPDGCGWLFVGDALARIHPDGTIEEVLKMEHTGQLFFAAGDLYIYNGGRDRFGGFTEVLRIRDVLAQQ